jgi:hypothetical protein
MPKGPLVLHLKLEPKHAVPVIARITASSTTLATALAPKQVMFFLKGQYFFSCHQQICAFEPHSTLWLCDKLPIGAVLG